LSCVMVHVVYDTNNNFANLLHITFYQFVRYFHQIGQFSRLNGKNQFYFFQIHPKFIPIKSLPFRNKLNKLGFLQIIQNHPIPNHHFSVVCGTQNTSLVNYISPKPFAIICQKNKIINTIFIIPCRRPPIFFRPFG
jgi:hypothetical protein